MFDREIEGLRKMLFKFQFSAFYSIDIWQTEIFILFKLNFGGIFFLIPKNVKIKGLFLQFVEPRTSCTDYFPRSRFFTYKIHPKEENENRVMS